MSSAPSKIFSKLSALALLCIAMSVAGWTLYIFDHQAEVQNTSLQIGEVASKTQTIKRRLPSQFVWSELDTNSQVFQKDTIRSSENSSALILLNKGKTKGEIRLGPESLITLDSDGERLSLDLAEGDLFFRGQFSARVAGTDIESTDSNTTASISVSKEGALQMETQSGALKVSQEGQESQLLPGEILSQNEQGEARIQKIAYRFLNPTPFEVQKAETQEIEITIAIEAIENTNEDTDAQDHRLQLQISQDPDFKNVESYSWSQEENVSRLEKQLSLKEGSWHLRLVGISPKDSEQSPVPLSGVRQFQLESLPSLSWKKGTSGREMNAKIEGKELQYFFSWNSIPGTHRYLLSLIGDDEKILASSESISEYQKPSPELSEAMMKQVRQFEARNDSSLSDFQWKLRLRALDAKGQDIVQALQGTVVVQDERPAARISKLEVTSINFEALTMALELEFDQALRKGSEVFTSLMGRKRKIDPKEASLDLKLVSSHVSNFNNTIGFYVSERNGKISGPHTLELNSAEVDFPRLLAEDTLLLFPAMDSRLASDSEITFSWLSPKNEIHRPKEYSLTITKQSSGKSVVHKAKKESLSLNKLSAGRYSWSVLPIWQFGHNGKESAKGIFEIFDAHFNQAPVLHRSPSNTSENDGNDDDY